MEYLELFSSFKFDIGESVYLKNDQNQNMRFVTAVCVRENGVTYALSFMEVESWHYGFEITKDQDFNKTKYIH